MGHSAPHERHGDSATKVRVLNDTTLKNQVVLTLNRFLLTIILRAHVGYEMINNQRGDKRRVGYNHLISNKCEWNNCFIKNNLERNIAIKYLADFALQEQPEGNLMVYC